MRRNENKIYQSNQPLEKLLRYFSGDEINLFTNQNWKEKFLRTEKSFILVTG